MKRPQPQVNRLSMRRQHIPTLPRSVYQQVTLLRPLTFFPPL
jgi:hypothetical protein